jgi:hypothetical protein
MLLSSWGKRLAAIVLSSNYCRRTKPNKWPTGGSSKDEIIPQHSLIVPKHLRRRSIQSLAVSSAVLSLMDKSGIEALATRVRGKLQSVREALKVGAPGRPPGNEFRRSA